MCVSVTCLWEGLLLPRNLLNLLLFHNQVKPAPRLVSLPQQWQPSDEERWEEKSGLCQNKIKLIVLGRGMGYRWTAGSPSLCGSRPRGRDAALCPEARMCWWVAQGDAQQVKLGFSFCLFSPLSCETDVSWPCHRVCFWSFSSAACMSFKAFQCQSWPLLRERKSISRQQTSPFKIVLV